MMACFVFWRSVMALAAARGCAQSFFVETPLLVLPCLALVLVLVFLRGRWGREPLVDHLAEHPEDNERRNGHGNVTTSDDTDKRRRCVREERAKRGACDDLVRQ